MQGRRLGERAGLLDQRLLDEGPVRAAFENGGIATGSSQHAGSHGDMLRFAAVGGAGQCQSLVGELVGVSRTALDQGQRLHRLAGRPRENAGLDIAEREYRLAVAVDGDHHAAMPAFDEIAARNFHQYRVRHDPALKFPSSNALLAEVLNKLTRNRSPI